MTKKKASILEVTLLLPKNFEKTLENEMEDEIKIASMKWGVRLSKDEKNTVLTSSRIQLANKVSTVAGAPWTLDSSKLKVIVATTKRGTFKITLPFVDGSKYSVNLIRVHHKWQVEQDPNNDSVPIEEFYDSFVSQLKTWARTAVLYGVGSYQN